MITEITDDDIKETCRLLGLPENAFHGNDGNDPRQDVLKSLETIDVNACPGSGKTTLLVAKLALISKKWPYRTRGICVLSHTNAARQEIEDRLGHTEAGKNLLKYPNFVGTIHKFVDHFIAIPYLKSIGKTPKIIDTKMALSWRWNRLYGYKTGLEIKHHTSSVFAMESLDGQVADISGIGNHTPTYRRIVEINRSSIEQGIFTFDDMFLWAHAAMENPVFTSAIKYRFPFVFIDEAQDNNEIQSALLQKVFPISSDGTVRQRLGDSNQAIYNYSGQKGADTDPFPFQDMTKVRTLPNSHRFGQEIADLCNPFAALPVEGGLTGQGPNTSRADFDSARKHTLILFAPDKVQEVLPKFGEILCEAIKDNDSRRNGEFVAICGVHNAPEEEKEAPHYIGHYFPAYNANSGKPDSLPDTFLEYLHSAEELYRRTKNSKHLVDSFNHALLYAIHLADGDLKGLRVKRKYRFVRERLNRTNFLHLTMIKYLVEKGASIEEELWRSHWVKAINWIMRDIDPALDCTAVTEFFEWRPAPTPVSEDAQGLATNTYIYKDKEGVEIKIRLGSIHSVKGQTHTATLVLDSYRRTYHLKNLKKCLLNKPLSNSDRTDSRLERMRLHYVAMSRPTHLLCVATRMDHFNEKEINYLAENTNWKLSVLD